MKKILVMSLVVVGFLGVFSAQKVLAANVWGWAWSENVGWISFNCLNDYNNDGIRENHCAAGGNVDYGVQIDNLTGLFSGYAWSENIGWITFNQADLAGCPSGSCNAKVDLSTRQVSGWAKPLFIKRYEHYIGATYPSMIYGSWDLRSATVAAQIFKIGDSAENENFKTVKARVKLASPTGNPTLHLAIKETQTDPYAAGGKIPVNEELCFGNITNITTAGWHEAILSGPSCNLLASHRYALVLNNPDITGNTYVGWNLESFNSGGGPAACSYNGYGISGWEKGVVGQSDGASYWNWITNGSWFDYCSDFIFEIYGLSNNFIKLNPDAAGANGMNILDNGFKGWAFGGANSNDEAVIGLISFNGNNVETDLPPLNSAPIAAISCNPSSCSVFRGDPLILNNNSTDSNGMADITQSQWWTKFLTDPAAAYILQNTCVFCNYTPSLGLGGASDYRDYTAKLRVTDAGGLYSEAEKTFTIKRGLNVDFQCKLKAADPWQICSALNPVSGEVILLNDISNPSYVSTGSSITSRIWNKNDVDGNFDFSISNNPTPTTGFKAPSASLRLTVTDNAGKTQSITYIINGKMRLPTWKEVNPAW